jgi:hypothetical protein
MARGKKVEPHVAFLIKIWLDAGRLSCVQIAKELDLAPINIYRIKLNFDLYNAPYPPSIWTKGRPQAFTPEQQAVSGLSMMRSGCGLLLLLLTATDASCGTFFHCSTTVPI